MTLKLTMIDGISYFTPKVAYQLQGRDGMVAIDWGGKPPIPLLSEDFSGLEPAGQPDYDMVGRGIYQALRKNPDCLFAAEYAAILKQAYPHIISELGGQLIMLEARDVDTPYLDRRINGLKIMSLLEPDNARLLLEIGRVFADLGTRLSNLHQAVNSWYQALYYLEKANKLDSADYQISYEYGEALYVVGRYTQATAVWAEALPGLSDVDRTRVSALISALLSGKQPLVPPLDYLTALAMAVESHQEERYEDSVAIIEDVLSDNLFVEQFPMNEVYYLLGDCYQKLGMEKKAGEAFRRS